jgi:hypothetical protein
MLHGTGFCPSEQYLGGISPQVLSGHFIFIKPFPASYSRYRRQGERNNPPGDNEIE